MTADVLPYVLNREDIIKLIPHGESMSLLNGVMVVNEKEIICEAISQQEPKNPLLFNGKLSALAAAEYAGQAVALHRHHLIKNFEENADAPRQGYLAALKNVQFFVDYLSDAAYPLQITASCVFINADKALYEFKVSAANRLLASGEMIVAGGQ